MRYPFRTSRRDREARESHSTQRLEINLTQKSKLTQPTPEYEAIPGSESKPRVTFLTLPAELRLQIFSYLLPSTSAPEWRISDRLSLRHDRKPITLSILRLNRHLYAEALSLMYPRWQLQLSLFPCPHDLGSAGFFTAFLKKHKRIPEGFKFITSFDINLEYWEEDPRESYAGTRKLIEMSICHDTAMPALKKVHYRVLFGRRYLRTYRWCVQEQVKVFTKVLGKVTRRKVKLEGVAMTARLDKENVWGEEQWTQEEARTFSVGFWFVLESLVGPGTRMGLESR